MSWYGESFGDSSSSISCTTSEDTKLGDWIHPTFPSNTPNKACRVNDAGSTESHCETYDDMFDTTGKSLTECMAFGVEKLQQYEAHVKYPNNEQRAK